MQRWRKLRDPCETIVVLQFIVMSLSKMNYYSNYSMSYYFNSSINYK